MNSTYSFQILIRTAFLALLALLGSVLMSPAQASGEDDRNGDGPGSDWIGDEDLDQGVPWDFETCQGDSFPVDALRVQQEVFDCGDDFSDCFELPRAVTKVAPEIIIPSPEVFRVKHKPGKKWVTSAPQFQHWDNAGVPKERQKGTYIAITKEPKRRDVRHVVFTLSGQQRLRRNSTLITGQGVVWRDAFECNPSRSSMIDILHRGFSSLPYKIMMADRGDGNPLRSLDDTFVAMAYDHQYNFDTTGAGAKQDRIRDAFLSWLKSKFFSSKIQTVFIAGHSRGGCLGARLARSLAKDLSSEVKIMLQIYDGVGMNNELGKERVFRGVLPLGPRDKPHTVKNPIRKGAFARQTRFDLAFPRGDDHSTWTMLGFPSSRNVRVVNFVSGASGPVGVRAMCYEKSVGGAVTFEIERQGIPFYRQQWVNESHGGMKGPAMMRLGWKHAVQMCRELCCGGPKV